MSVDNSRIAKNTVLHPDDLCPRGEPLDEDNGMKKYKVGYTCSVFDLLHVGNLNLLERCREMCDKLIVGVCDDTYVNETKHKVPVIGVSIEYLPYTKGISASQLKLQMRGEK